MTRQNTIEISNFTQGRNGPIKSYLVGHQVTKFEKGCTVQAPSKATDSFKVCMAFHSPSGILLTMVGYTKAENGSWSQHQLQESPVVADHKVMAWLLSPEKANLPVCMHWNGVVPQYNNQMLNRWRSIKAQHSLEQKYFDDVFEKTRSMQFDVGHPSQEWKTYTDMCDLALGDRLFVLLNNKWEEVFIEDHEDDFDFCCATDELTTQLQDRQYSNFGYASVEHGFRMVRLENNMFEAMPEADTSPDQQQEKQVGDHAEDDSQPPASYFPQVM